MEKLINLVRRDVGQDSPVRVDVEKPIGTDGAVQAMRSEAGRVDHTADIPRGDDFLRHDGGGNDEAFGETDRENAPGFAHGLLDDRKLIEGRDAGLVDHHVLAVRHCIGRDSGPVSRNRRADNRIDVRIFEETPPIAHLCELGKAFLETCEHPRVACRGIVAGAIRAGRQ